MKASKLTVGSGLLASLFTVLLASSCAKTADWKCICRTGTGTEYVAEYILNNSEKDAEALCQSICTEREGDLFARIEEIK